MSRHDYEPMLAKAAAAIPSGDGWVIEPKWNGFRLIAGHHDDGVWLELRGRNRVTTVPYIEAAVDLDTPAQTVLDGELVSVEKGIGHVQSVVRTHASHVPTAASPMLSYVVFDVLALDGEDVRGEAWEDRRERLEQVARYWTSDRLILSPVGPPDERFYAKCIELGFEGVMAKSVNATYRSGRRPSWRKIKVEGTVDVVVTAIYDSNDDDSWLAQEDLPGKLGFGYWDSERREAVEISRVGTGFDKTEREDIRDHPDRWLGSVIEVKHFEALATGKYRHPVYVGRRDDKAASDAVRQGDVPSTAVAVAEEPEPEEEPMGTHTIDSPARSGTGRLRNIKAMKDAKLLDLQEQMHGSPDTEAVDAIDAEVRARGL